VVAGLFFGLDTKDMGSRMCRKELLFARSRVKSVSRAADARFASQAQLFPSCRSAGGQDVQGRKTGPAPEKIGLSKGGVGRLRRICRAYLTRQDREHFGSRGGLSDDDASRETHGGHRWYAPSDGNVILSMSSASAQIDLPRLRARREEILGFAAEHGARNVRVFGSVVRGEPNPSSDVDLLVEMEPGRSLIDLVGLWQDLEDMLGTHVDVLSDGGVSPHLRERIYAEAVTL
jgi:predicted nucleotidyltransferase